MLNSLVALVFAHVMADFLVQTRCQVEAKRRPPVFAWHIASVAVLTAAALGVASTGGWFVIALVTFSHAVIDGLKIYPRAEAWATARRFGALELFALDQALHLGFIALAAGLWPRTFASGVWPAWLGDAGAHWLVAGLALAGGFWFATRAGDLLLRLLMDGFQLTSRLEAASPPGAGTWIGWLERSLVFFFVLLGQFNAIGFVMAAKSILRFEHARKPGLSEIVIIGTLASFAWAIGNALAVNYVLSSLGMHLT